MKQLYFNFVLPPLLISLLLWSIIVWETGVSISSAVVFVLITLLILFNLRTANHIKRLRNNLVNIEKGSLIKIDDQKRAFLLN